MGLTVNIQEVKLKHKLTTSFRQDQQNSQEIAAQINQLNQSLTQMVDAMAELSNQLADYVRALSQSIDRFHTILRPIDMNQRLRNLQIPRDLPFELQQGRNQDNLIQLENITPQNRFRLQSAYQMQLNRNRRIMDEIQSQINTFLFKPIAQEEEESFWSRAYNYCANKISSFVELVALSS